MQIDTCTTGKYELVLNTNFTFAMCPFGLENPQIQSHATFAFELTFNRNFFYGFLIV